MSKHLLSALALLLAALLLPSCGDVGETPPPSQVATGEQNETAAPTDLPAAAKNPTGKEADKRFVTAVTDFSQTLFRKCAISGENLILSPLSLTYALTLTSNGARGDTLAEFEVLNGGIPLADMNEYLFWNAYNLSSTKQSKVKIANSVWTDDGFAVNPQFGWVAEKYYNAAAFSRDFTADATVDEINGWVSERTDGMIDQVLTAPPADLVMLLINTVLFDGKWETPYPESNVRDGTFRNADGTESTVKMMYSHEQTCFTGDGYAGFGKAYLDGYRFIALLPDEGTDVADFAASLDWSIAIDTALHGNVHAADCYLPKFEAEWEMGLNEILMEMGLTKAFGGGDLGGLAAEEGAGLYISSVRQKAKIRVDEEGTKAAAYTEVAVAECEYPLLRLDRPFVYAVVAEDTGLPLFMGISANLG